MRVVWSNRALRSLADIHSHISTDSQDAAHRTVDRILKRGDQLASFTEIIDVFHSAQLPPWER